MLQGRPSVGARPSAGRGATGLEIGVNLSTPRKRLQNTGCYGPWFPFGFLKRTAKGSQKRTPRPKVQMGQGKSEAVPHPEREPSGPLWKIVQGAASSPSQVVQRFSYDTKRKRSSPFRATSRYFTRTTSGKQCPPVFSGSSFRRFLGLLKFSNCLEKSPGATAAGQWMSQGCRRSQSSSCNSASKTLFLPVWLLLFFFLPVGLPRFFIFSYFFFFVLYRLLFPLAWRILLAALVPSFFLGCLLPLFGAGHPV